MSIVWCYHIRRIRNIVVSWRTAPSAALRLNDVSAITYRASDGLFPNLEYTLVMVATTPDDVKIMILSICKIPFHIQIHDIW